MIVVTYIFRGSFALAGLLFTFIGIRLIVKSYHLKKHGLRTVGIITRVKRVYHYEGLILHYPIVKIKTESGKVIEFRSSIGKSHIAPTVGDQVPVLYHRKHPENAEIDSPFRLRRAPVILLLTGVFFLVLAVLTFR